MQYIIRMCTPIHIYIAHVQQILCELMQLSRLIYSQVNYSSNLRFAEFGRKIILFTLTLRFCYVNFTITKPLCAVTLQLSAAGGRNEAKLHARTALSWPIGQLRAAVKLNKLNDVTLFQSYSLVYFFLGLQHGFLQTWVNNCW